MQTKTYDLENGVYPKNEKKYQSSKLFCGYMLWMLFAALTAFNLYLDYRCSYNVVVPVTYIYAPGHTVYDQLQKRSVDTETIQSDTLSFEHAYTDVFARRSVDTVNTVTVYECINNADCNHGTCEPDKNITGATTGSACVCDADYITVDNDVCNYQQLSGLVALLLSIFLGGCGIDRCFLSRGDGCYICVGITKGITVGGLGIWWLVDIILIATANLNDGNGQPLSPI